MSRWLSDLLEFNYSVLSDPEFKEDAVREEIIVPLLKALGYNYDGEFKIVRGRPLKVPYYMIGSRKYEVSIFPDYILEVGGKCACVVEIKAPTESLYDAKHIGQAYSYAAHREVQANFFALCNGLEFHLYSTRKEQPLIVFRMESIKNHFPVLNSVIGTEYISMTSNEKYNKDLGIHLKMLFGREKEMKYTFMGIPIYEISHVDKGLYTVSASPILDNETYCGSFDFGEKVLKSFEQVLPKDAMDVLLQPFDGRPTVLNFADKIIDIGIECVLGDKIYENRHEHYMPLNVTKLLYADWK